MNQQFHQNNRKTLYESLRPGSLALLFSGRAPRKTNDEYYPYFANRNFVYLTGVTQQESILLAYKPDQSTEEILFIPPGDPMFERWNGSRIKPGEAEQLSGCSHIRFTDKFLTTVDQLLQNGKVSRVYLDFDKLTADEPDSPAYKFAAYVKERYPFIKLYNLQPQLRRQRTIKADCEITAMRKAEEITRAGIIAMMQSSKPGMYEYQYKAEFDYALMRHGVLEPGFPPIISAGSNNFFIHYYDYTGLARDGDMILNDVGAVWDNEINDVSRGWPCNGRFSERQKLLYQCAYNTSEYMFSILKPGMPMKSVDETIRRYNFEQLKAIGLCDKYEDVGRYIWHGGAHHVGYDVHDLTEKDMMIAPNMIFCVDVGIYCEEWGIGFRLEDNCLITPDGCENLSAGIPRTIEEIEAVMGK